MTAPSTDRDSETVEVAIRLPRRIYDILDRGLHPVYGATLNERMVHGLRSWLLDVPIHLIRTDPPANEDDEQVGSTVVNPEDLEVDDGSSRARADGVVYMVVKAYETGKMGQEEVSIKGCPVTATMEPGGALRFDTDRPITEDLSLVMGAIVHAIMTLVDGLRVVNAAGGVGDTYYIYQFNRKLYGDGA